MDAGIFIYYSIYLLIKTILLTINLTKRKSIFPNSPMKRKVFTSYIKTESNAIKRRETETPDNQR